MPKDFGSFFSRIKGRKVSFFGRIRLNFGFKKVISWLYHSGTVRHSTVKEISKIASEYFNICIWGSGYHSQ